MVFAAGGVFAAEGLVAAGGVFATAGVVVAGEVVAAEGLVAAGGFTAAGGLVCPVGAITGTGLSTCLHHTTQINCVVCHSAAATCNPAVSTCKIAMLSSIVTNGLTRLLVAYALPQVYMAVAYAILQATKA